MNPSGMPAAPTAQPRAQWLEVVARTPLVSIDLIVHDAAGRVLLGWRRNRPAQHSWFVPGGVVRKDESLDAAFARIAAGELGLALRRVDAQFVGVFEHRYPDNFAGADAITTHYVVLAHRVQVAALPEGPGDDQHGAFRAFTPQQLLAAADVHPYTKAYFEAGRDGIVPVAPG